MPNVTTTCKVGIAISEIPEKYRSGLAELLKNRPSISGGETDEQICERLHKVGYQISPNTIGRHRSERCVCFRWAN